MSQFLMWLIDVTGLFTKGKISRWNITNHSKWVQKGLVSRAPSLQELSELC